jgi:hypothetical protein
MGGPCDIHHGIEKNFSSSHASKQGWLELGSYTVFFLGQYFAQKRYKFFFQRIFGNKKKTLFQKIKSLTCYRI